MVEVVVGLSNDGAGSRWEKLKEMVEEVKERRC